MTDLIRRLMAWVSLLFIPREAPRTHPAAQRPTSRAMKLPAHRSPYSLDTPLDGTATIAVRPYVTAHEQRERRRELALAALGLDTPGPYWIHGLEVA
ncbi:hypothetical protein [Streptomyces sp. NBC_01483]|uniref:hypothetical protein n=1 Tax=Streptomyces sp. NBC_01483 TaxID=2903883 RepID=UPI002E375B09|nr:hypothetical protein [Streptomyces sp. NBC_01483]